MDQKELLYVKLLPNRFVDVQMLIFEKNYTPSRHIDLSRANNNIRLLLYYIIRLRIQNKIFILIIITSNYSFA